MTTSLEKVCMLCACNTFYPCVTCDCGICNRPSCSRTVDTTHLAYSEEHPKKISECNTCSSKLVPRKTPKQPTIEDFFANK